MKSLARGYFWYPNLDKDIENLVRSCPACLSVRAQPEKAHLIKWEPRQKPFDRIHLDFFGPINGKMFMILVDSYSKWVEDSPSKLMFGRKPKTHLDLLLADSENKGDNQRKYFKGERVAEFKEGEEVYARDYRNPNREEWKKARVIEVMGDRTYLVEEGTDGLEKTFRPTDRDRRLLQGRTRDEEGRDRREGQEMKKEETEDGMEKDAMEGTYSAEVVKEMSKRQGENEEITENRQNRQAEDINEERNVSKQERGNNTLNIDKTDKRKILMKNGMFLSKNASFFKTVWHVPTDNCTSCESFAIDFLGAPPPGLRVIAPVSRNLSIQA
ncbi:Integrase zinc binding domain [Popillia japonica]|uniref:RNA-directed DNA polymerase n=1 Tax=Popillia japonica TaxID=7064 RepID=A0AAW1L254_POPJA